MLVKN